MPFRVLVVDDSVMYRVILKEMFDLLGHQVVAEAETGAAAAELYLAHKPDLVTLDVSLPDTDGIAVLRELKAADPKARVLMVTGNDQDKIVRQAAALGALGLIVKPFKKEQIAEALAKIPA